MLSLTGKTWQIADWTSDDLITQLLAQRGVGEDTRARFLAPSLAELHDPRQMKDMQKAVERIQRAIVDSERIFVVGDYDVDGVVGSAILYKALTHLGAQVSVRLPHRMRDGYGLNVRMVDEAKEKSVGLIITVDNGIAATPAIERAVELGVDVIVTDHHLPPAQLPPAYAIVNPRQDDCSYPFGGLAGAAVGWKLATLIGEYPAKLADELLALAALGTIADICPLVDENRAIVTAGLQHLPHVQHPGLQHLLEIAGVSAPVSAEDIGFRVGPRLNAAGRLDSALTAFQALTHPAHGPQFAQQLDEMNLRRRAVSEEIMSDALERIGEVGTEPLIIGSSTSWPRGVIGLAAGRLAERYYRPVILMEEDGIDLVGSCRCPLPDFNITDALTSCADMLTHFGGHRAAAGFTLPVGQQAAFITRMQAYAEAALADAELTPSLAIATELTETDLTLQTIDTIQQLAPFGAGNPEPIFVLRGTRLSNLKLVGKDESHLACSVGSGQVKAIGFGLGEHLAAAQQRETVDLAVTLAKDEWQGRTRVQLMIQDIAAGSSARAGA